ncbi:hypothetical protein [Streptomyces albidochromogenes]|uniref:hypothetical protein n=1 Tax=Streptomyces albidochromogenes TaxID=329524 RepID=UPI00110F742E|nr:hypothetical protein [Streptomyces albidochromogenes]
MPGAGPGRVAAAPSGRKPDRRPPPGRPGPGFAVLARFLPDSSFPGVAVAPEAPAVVARAAGQAAARRLARTGRAHVGGRLALQVLGTPAGPARTASSGKPPAVIEVAFTARSPPAASGRR